MFKFVDGKGKGKGSKINWFLFSLNVIGHSSAIPDVIDRTATSHFALLSVCPQPTRPKILVQ